MENKRYSGILIEDDTRLKSKYKKHVEAHFDLIMFEDTKSSLHFVLANSSSVSFCLVRLLLDDIRVMITFLEKIRSINPFIKIIFIESSDLIESRYGAIINKYEGVSITSIAGPSEIIKCISSLIVDSDSPKRKYSRVDWPLHARVTFNTDSGINIFETNVLSISGNGAYIEDSDNVPQKDESVDLTISFKNFKLFTKAKVVWTNDGLQRKDYPKGYAVTFLDITQISQKVIDDIIQDKILQDIMF